MQRAAQELGPQAGPHVRPNARAARALHPLAWSLMGGSRPSVPSSSSRRGSGELKHAIGELSAFAVRRASFPSSTRTH